jgi:hypothetical protein
VAGPGGDGGAGGRVELDEVLPGDAVDGAERAAGDELAVGADRERVDRAVQGR